jgi:hypothetical protein
MAPFVRARPAMEEQIQEHIRPTEAAEQDELLLGPMTQLCVEIDALCDRADPILARLDQVCERLPSLLRRVATPW